jgi:hypothetical protein
MASRNGRPEVTAIAAISGRDFGNASEGVAFLRRLRAVFVTPWVSPKLLP